MPGPRLYALFAKDITQLCRCVQSLEGSTVFKLVKKWVQHVCFILVARVAHLSWIFIDFQWHFGPEHMSERLLARLGRKLPASSAKMAS